MRRAGKSLYRPHEKKGARLAPHPRRENKSIVVSRSPVNPNQLVHHQFVFDAERARYGTGSQSGNGLVHRVLDSTVEGHVSVVYHDADLMRWLGCVFAQHRVAIDRASRLHSDRIVKTRSRQNLYIVHPALDASRARHDGEGRVLWRVPQGVAAKGYDSVFH